MLQQIVKIFYLGNRYHGSQIQPGFNTIQGELIRALSDWCSDSFDQSSVVFAGRTDRGVHSLGQVVRIDCSKKIDIDKVNKFLPEDIVLWAYSNIPKEFHPRYDVLLRHYRYYIPTSQHLDTSKIRKALGSMIGTHDFHLLSKPDGNRLSTVTVLNACISSIESPFSIDFIGNSFLWKLVRKTITVLKDIGAGNIEPNAISCMLKGERRYPGGIQPAPPESLILLESVVPFKFFISKYAIKKINRILKDTAKRLLHTSYATKFMKHEIISFQKLFV